MANEAWHHLYNSTRWRRLRKVVLNEEPICRMCMQLGKAKPSDIVDHIKPHKGDESLFWDRDNLQGLCRDCHERVKSLQETRGYAAGCGVDGLPIDGEHPWNKM